MYVEEYAHTWTDGHGPKLRKNKSSNSFAVNLEPHCFLNRQSGHLLEYEEVGENYKVNPFPP